MIKIKSAREIALMRDAGKVAASVLQELESAIQPGITTAELDKLAEKLIRRAGGEPAFLGYQGFPASICTSINSEVVHGIPGLHRLKEGDIISIDLGVLLKGYYSDTAVTFGVGKISPLAGRLIDVTRQSLEEGISAMRSGGYLSDISHAIQKYVEANGFSIVYSYTGHGIGTSMHEEPSVPNFGPPGRGPKLQPGMVLAIEPMVNAGSAEVEVRDDGWTVLTKDRSLSAHFEHSVALAKDGPVILTIL
ncbi:MAG: type I methionyl aminopeptidase [Dethiobacteria bacterium]|jgi:methionyl aminopeptidase|nr:type I methionyl aminopeptidase [Bacillota bacterium]NMD34075.1 type I methionyl aminopeptidase [Bacillota bacterium]HOB29117.1 type I methionyl aminopeptidase [Bacillota bacterium]HPZ41689.1 type I methionyl aminopeptidase [Bacillota bacterium]HQD52257.1 type I methionyl aminopeptidase [Bacillota bacterium]